jgi:hypothetical protein
LAQKANKWLRSLSILCNQGGGDGQQNWNGNRPGPEIRLTLNALKPNGFRAPVVTLGDS